MEQIVSLFCGFPPADGSTIGLIMYTVWCRFIGFECAYIDKKEPKEVEHVIGESDKE